MERLKLALADRYVIEREVGAGGMATVYLARDLKHDRDVAVKVLRPELAAALGAERFLKEIEVTANLQHPHILPLYDSGEVDTFLYYVMPYIEGESLRDKLNREKQLAVEETVEIAKSVAGALSFAHARGVIHRDIKPENILLQSGQPLVADFGIALAVSQAGGARLTDTGLSLGTPEYMSPEQAAGDRTLDARSDVYSLGAVVYEMLSGEPPFTGKSTQAIMARLLTERPTPLRVLRDQVPENVHRAVMKALGKAPADRFSTAARFMEALAASGPSRVERRPLSASQRVLVVLASLVLLGALWMGRELFVANQESNSTFDPRRIAVLYFDDHSPGRTFAYLADGLTEALIHELSQIKGLEVISRNGVKPFANTGVALDSIVRQLKVGTLVEGSVVRSQDRVRVTVQLIDAANLTHLESHTVERPWGELFALQDEITDEVARVLRERLGEEIRARESRFSTNSVEAWELVQRAHQVLESIEEFLRPDNDVQGAIRRLAQADSLLAVAELADPLWTEPLVQRGQVALWTGLMRGVIDEIDYMDDSTFTEQLRRGIAFSERALALAPAEPSALELRGKARRFLGLFAADSAEAATMLQRAEGDLRGALAAEPSRASAWSELSELLQGTGRINEANRAAQRAFENDAFLDNASQILRRLFWTSLELGAEVDAVRWCEEGRRRFASDPTFLDCAITLMAISSAVEPDADRAWRLIGEYPDGLDRNLLMMAAVLTREGHVDSGQAVLRQAGGEIVPGSGQSVSLQEIYIRVMMRDTLLERLLSSGYADSILADSAMLARDFWGRALFRDSRFRELAGREN